eukprot:COSAG06_NODE_19734_length_824_cov_3.406897_2_plen_103_part_01
MEACARWALVRCRPRYQTAWALDATNAVAVAIEHRLRGAHARREVTALRARSQLGAHSFVTGSNVGVVPTCRSAPRAALRASSLARVSAVTLSLPILTTSERL